MRRIVVTEFMTLDGVMEDPGGAEKFEHGGWAFQFNRGPDGDKFKTDELFASDSALLGRKTYQEFEKAWSSRTGEFADKMNSMAKYVASTTLKKPEWNNTTIIKSNIAQEVARLKNTPGQDILVAGSAQLVHTLIENDLVDEFRLMVFPIVLGKGKRLFNGASDKHALQLVKMEPVGSEGVITLTYHRQKK